MSVSEYSCGKPTCPNQHTAIFVMSQEGVPRKISVHKPLADISGGRDVSAISRATCAPVRCPPIVEAGCSSSPPIPDSGIAPERISRVRTLLDGLPTAPGLAVALPGGPDGDLDAVVLRPDGVLGLVPAGASRRVGVGAAVPDGGGAGSQELAAAEIDRLLALTDPAPTAPRQVVPIVDRRPPTSSSTRTRSAPTRTRASAWRPRRASS